MTVDQIRAAWAADAAALSAHFHHDVEALRFQVDRRRFGSFTTTCAGSASERDRYQRALDYARKQP